jgi:hypothetical protein
MQQLFHTRNYSVRDFEEWQERNELVLAPRFQRRDVWNAKARSYLIDTIIRGKPIPKLYMRQSVNPSNRRTTREIVDGQQRLRTILSFIDNGFRISKTHNSDFGGRYFSQLDATTQSDILKYEFVVDLLQDMPDNEVYDVFARLNTYSEKLKPQELRNAKWFGEFKSSVYLLTKGWVGFLVENEVFTAKQVLRMNEAEFISELLLAMEEGIREGSKTVIDKAYEKYDDQFPNRRRHEVRFRETADTLAAIAGSDFPKLKFRATRLLYPFYCATYHMKFGLARLQAPRQLIKPRDFPKLRVTLENIDDLISRIEAAYKADEELKLNADEARFHEAYAEHWVHASNRTILTQYLCKQFAKTLR